MKKKRKTITTNRVFTIVSIVFLLAGMSFVLYSPVSNLLYSNAQNQIIKEYDYTFYSDKTNNTNTTVKTKKQNNKKASINYDKLRKDIKKYNKEIYQNKQASFGASASFGSSALNLKNYGIDNDVYGYIQIAKINLNMALYLGANDYNMSVGAAHLGGTSIPYGGTNTHSVIAGHCGYGACNYFRDLENLTKGDIVIIAIPFKKIKYKVIDKKVIKPNETENFKIRKNKDAVTLFTCYPYPTNKYRICIVCERV